MSQRLMKDIRELHAAVEDGELDEVEITQDGDQWELAIPGQGAYAAGVFRVGFAAQGFPSEAPVLNFRTRIYHPQVNADGTYCSKLLNPANWNKFTTLRQLVEEIMDLFTQSDFPNPSNAEVGAAFKADRQKYLATCKEWVQLYAKK
ncbi:Ubiquitin-conjugating enzyme E2 [Spironucleus salmonicida]|uniref:Ubiquitin-conjugating enzyme E2 n=2 Tax=Spironucleus salmonicida TaxID=348837 RepID=V6LRW1_9EUKA|nr:Ubiquitin-conjugating enzyme E2 [Spironucleus salmonicida]KAH0577486.1 Ubiquitin-conjugating enzyme E2 [Spironucleus salmonicida]|eukprot:EST43519.1 Ubiquitin-conjugating enzyme E2 [Spironucleus salmonicida]